MSVADGMGQGFRFGFCIVSALGADCSAAGAVDSSVDTFLESWHKVCKL